MAAPSRETLERIASETGHQPATLEKVLRLLDILQMIAEDENLSTAFVLKGGTALNVFYLKLDRLSVDIDLNYVGSAAQDTMLAERPMLETTLNRILASQGYQVRRQPVDHAGGKWVARYQSSLGGNANLEVDVNYMMRVPLFGVQRMDSIKLGNYQAFNVPVLDIHEVAAGKLAALLDRQAGRDLFDARRLFATPNIDWQRVRIGLLAIGAGGRRDWRQVSVQSIGGDPRELREKLMICLPRTAFPNAAAVTAWIAESVRELQGLVAPLIDYSPSERAFLDALLDHGRTDVSLIDTDEDTRKRIAALPMLSWKAENVRKKRSDK